MTNKRRYSQICSQLSLLVHSMQRDYVYIIKRSYHFLPSNPSRPVPACIPAVFPSSMVIRQHRVSNCLQVLIRTPICVCVSEGRSQQFRTQFALHDQNKINRIAIPYKSDYRTMAISSVQEWNPPWVVIEPQPLVSQYTVVGRIFSINLSRTKDQQPAAG